MNMRIEQIGVVHRKDNDVVTQLSPSVDNDAVTLPEPSVGHLATISGNEDNDQNRSPGEQMSHSDVTHGPANGGTNLTTVDPGNIPEMEVETETEKIPLK